MTAAPWSTGFYSSNTLRWRNADQRRLGRRRLAWPRESNVDRHSGDPKPSAISVLANDPPVEALSPQREGSHVHQLPLEARLRQINRHVPDRQLTTAGDLQRDSCLSTLRNLRVGSRPETHQVKVDGEIQLNAASHRPADVFVSLNGECRTAVNQTEDSSIGRVRRMSTTYRPGVLSHTTVPG